MPPITLRLFVRLIVPNVWKQHLAVPQHALIAMQDLCLTKPPQRDRFAALTAQWLKRSSILELTLVRHALKETIFRMGHAKYVQETVRNVQFQPLEFKFAPAATKDSS